MGIYLLLAAAFQGSAFAALYRQLSPAKDGTVSSRPGLELGPAVDYQQPLASSYTPMAPRATGAYLDGSIPPDEAPANAPQPQDPAAPRGAGNYLDGSAPPDTAQNSPPVAPDGTPPPEPAPRPEISLVTRYTATMDALRIDQAGVSFIQRGQSILSHGTAITALAFSPDGLQIVSAGADGGIKIWSRYRREMLAEIKGEGLPVTCVAISPDKGTILAAFREGMPPAPSRIKIMDALSGREMCSFVPHSQAITVLAFSPAGDRAVSASVDKTVKVWGATSGMEQLSWTHPEACVAGTFSQDGSRVVSASRDATVHIWDVWTAGAVASWPAIEGGPYRAAVSEGGEWIAFQKADHATRLMNVRTGLVAGEWIARGRTKAVYAANGSVVVWEVGAGELLAYHVQGGKYLNPQRSELGEIRCVGVSGDGMCVAAGGTDGRVVIWEAS